MTLIVSCSIRKMAASLLGMVLAFSSISSAREIVFPRLSGYQNPLGAASVDEIVDSNDISSAKFMGLTTFANLPYVHCLSNDTDVPSYDIAILGAPFDTGVTARPGARYGPVGVRLGSRRMHPSQVSIYTGKHGFENHSVVDCGDAPLTFLDNTVALKQLDKAHKVISSRNTYTKHLSAPRILTIGGDHTTTLSALRSTFEHFGPVSVIHFDSHLDTWDPSVLGGGISDYAGVNHGTFLHIAHEEGLLLDSSIHAGIRAPVINAKYDLSHDKACGFSIVKARDLDKLGAWGVINTLKKRVHGTNVYISVDIDVLDPAFAPATGTAEPGGWSTRELLTILDGLSGLKIVGADVGMCPFLLSSPLSSTQRFPNAVILHRGVSSSLLACCTHTYRIPYTDVA